MAAFLPTALSGVAIAMPAAATAESTHAVAWGWNFYGQLGNGTLTDRLESVCMTGPANLRDLAASASSSHTIAITAVSASPSP
ncbi:RCC1-like domain-containing protein [Streptosporangium sp. G11]|uniref:RCC1-like domain-containing protein n=1 Tax=Streptosporangium sp. G11 TaxID=3436926 RepID=UPI003EBFB12E